MKWLILLVLAAALVVVLTILFGKKKKTSGGPPPDLADLAPTDARRGDSVSVLAMGEDYNDLDFPVDRINRYESGGDVWHELSGRYRGGRVFLELYEDDHLEITLTKPDVTVSFSELPLAEADLIRFDESKSGGFDWNGARWDFSESCEIVYFEDGRGGGEGAYTWLFSEVGGDRCVFIEKWEGEAFEAGMGFSVSPSDVRVFRA